MAELRIVGRRMSLDGIPDAGIAHVYKLWLERRGARPMPAPGDMRPEEFGIALGKVNLLDVLRDPLRFVFRVRGTIISSMHNSTLTGRDVREMQPPVYRDMLIQHYSEAAVSGAPTLYHIEQSNGDVHSDYRRLIVPLGRPDGTVERLLTAAAWGPDFAEKARLLGFTER